MMHGCDRISLIELNHALKYSKQLINTELGVRNGVPEEQRVRCLVLPS